VKFQVMTYHKIPLHIIQTFIENRQIKYGATKKFEVIPDKFNADKVCN
jgi:hypothetical protein